MLIKKFLKTATFRHSAVSFLGTTITGILGLAFYSFVARELNPTSFGVFSLSVTTLALISSIANIGTDTGIIKFVSESATRDTAKAMRFLKLAFEIKIVIWIVLLVTGWIAMPWITQTFFGKEELITPFRIALVGVGGMLLSSLTLSALQAYSKFGLWSVVSIGANLFRLLAVVFVGLSGVLLINTTLWIYGGSLFLLFFVTLFFLPNFLKSPAEVTLRRQFLKFNQWVAIFTAIAAVGSRIDTYLTARYLSLSQVGTYAVGVTLVSFVTQIVLALGSVVAPKLSSIQEKKDAIKYLQKLQLFVIGLAISGVLVGIPLGYILIPLVYGVSYTSSFMPFSILLIGQAIFLLAVPAHMAVLYYFANPKLFVYTTVLRLGTTILLGAFLIPLFGENGAAACVLLGNVTDFVIPGTWVYIRFKK